MTESTMPQFDPDCPETGAARSRTALGALSKSAFSLICLPAVWIPFLIVLVLTLVFRLTDADMALVRPFFAGTKTGTTCPDRWPLMVAFPWKALYDWGIYPAWILGGGGLVVWIASFFWRKLEPWRDPGLFYGLLLLIGPGILVNVVFKPFWGRPRPNAIAEFGGQREFLPVLTLTQGRVESSFPSGHAATGFYLMAPAFVYYHRRRRLALAFLLLGIASGVVIGMARIVAGGHFPTDIIWAGAIVYFSGLLLAAPFKFGKPPPSQV